MSKHKYTITFILLNIFYTLAHIFYFLNTDPFFFDHGFAHSIESSLNLYNQLLKQTILSLNSLILFFKYLITTRPCNFLSLIIFTIFKPNYLILRIITTSILNFLFLLIIYRIGTLLLNRTLAFLSIILIASSPLYINEVRSLEHFFVTGLFFYAGILFLIKSNYLNNFKYSTIASLCFCLMFANSFFAILLIGITLLTFIPIFIKKNISLFAHLKKNNPINKLSLFLLPILLSLKHPTITTKLFNHPYSVKTFIDFFQNDKISYIIANDIYLIFIILNFIINLSFSGKKFTQTANPHLYIFFSLSIVLFIILPTGKCSSMVQCEALRYLRYTIAALPCLIIFILSYWKYVPRPTNLLYSMAALFFIFSNFWLFPLNKKTSTQLARLIPENYAFLQTIKLNQESKQNIEVFFKTISSNKKTIILNFYTDSFTQYDFINPYRLKYYLNKKIHFKNIHHEKWSYKYPENSDIFLFINSDTQRYNYNISPEEILNLNASFMEKIKEIRFIKKIEYPIRKHHIRIYKLIT